MIYFNLLLLAAPIIMLLLRGNKTALRFYLFQTALLFGLVLNLGENVDFWLKFWLFLIILVKASVVFYFLSRLIVKNNLKFNPGIYLNVPLSLIISAFLTFFSFWFLPWIALPLAAILSILFLIANTKGVMPQALGILALENSVLSAALNIGVHLNYYLELGMLFDIVIWVIAASALIQKVHQSFASEDSRLMCHLRD